MFKQVQKLTTLVVLWISLPLFLMLTNPETLPLPFLLVPFLLLGFSLYKTAGLGFRVVFKERQKRRLRILAVIAAFLPTLLLILSSIGQLTIRDTSIVLGLLALLTFYLRRIDFLKA